MGEKFPQGKTSDEKVFLNAILVISDKMNWKGSFQSGNHILVKL